MGRAYKRAMKRLCLLVLFLTCLGFLTEERAVAQATYGWNTTSISGTDASGTDIRYWAPGLNSGYFTFSYNFYTVPDSVVITFDGNVIYSSGGYVSGSGVVNLMFGPTPPGVTPIIEVEMNAAGPYPGTAWDYVLSPTTQVPVLSTLSILGPTVLGENATGVYQAIANYSNGGTRVVTASWKSSLESFKLYPVGSDLEAVAPNVSQLTPLTLTATYSEGGITVSKTLPVVIQDQPITNNPTEEQKQNPNTITRNDSLVGPTGSSSFSQDSGTASDPPPPPGDGAEPRVVTESTPVPAIAGADGATANTSTGAESFYRPLISLLGARDFEFGLNYSSTFPGTNSAVGLGWSHPFSAIIQDSGTSATIRWSPTQSNTYQLVQAASGGYYICPDDDTRFDVLAKLIDGGFSLTRMDQTVYLFDAGGYLKEIDNSRGQKLLVSFSGSQVGTIEEPVTGATLTFTYTSGLLTSIRDNAGRTVTLAYNSSSQLISITDLNGGVTSYTYSAGGQLITVTAPGGVLTRRNNYDAKGRLASQDDGLTSNLLTLFAYDESSRPGFVITTVTDRTGAKTEYTHDKRYRLISRRDALGHTYSYTYDEPGNRLTATDPLGRVTRMTYDAAGNVIRSVAPDGSETDITYDARRNPVQVVNADGKVATTTYDALNNPLQSTDFSGAVTVRTFNTSSQVLTETSPRHNTTTYAYTNGRLSSVTDSLGASHGFTYDAAGRVLTKVDEAGKTTAYTYSPSGKLLTETSPVNGVTTYTYDSRDRLVTVTNPVGAVTSQTYDANNNLISVTDALSGVETRQYDGEDRLIKDTDALGHATTFTYDAVGRLVSTKNALNQVTSYTYDSADNRLSVTQPNGSVTKFAYSPVDLVTTTTDPLGRVSTATRDVLGRIVSLNDPLHRITSTQYDEMGRTTATTNGLGLTTSRLYEADGNDAALANGADAVSSFSYDNEGREIRLTFPGGSRHIDYGHDPRGLVTSVTQPSGKVTTYNYDDAGRVVTRTDDVGATSYIYDANNRLLTTTEGAAVITRSYDALDRLTTFTDGQGNTLHYDYDAEGNLTTLTYPGGRQVTYTYDANNRMTSVTDWASRTTTYSYDAGGRLILTTRPNGTKQARTYDKDGEVTLLKETGTGGATLYSIAITYDADGEITSQVRTAPASGTPNGPAVVPSLDSMTYGPDDRLATFNGVAVTYDLDGNMTSGPIVGGTGTFIYDARNQLTSVNGAVTYGYDAEGRRISSTSGTTTTTYVNNPNAPLWQVLTYGTAASTTYCVYGLGLIYTDTGGSAVYHHYDLRGSTILTTDQAANQTFGAQYGVYGEFLDYTAVTPHSPFLFAGQAGVMTEPSGLCFCRARYYNPATRRFLNADPSGYEGGTNWYAYAGDDPVLETDPSGLDPEQGGNSKDGDSETHVSSGSGETHKSVHKSVSHPHGGGSHQSHGEQHEHHHHHSYTVRVDTSTYDSSSAKDGSGAASPPVHHHHHHVHHSDPNTSSSEHHSSIVHAGAHVSSSSTHATVEAVHKHGKPPHSHKKPSSSAPKVESYGSSAKGRP